MRHDVCKILKKAVDVFCRFCRMRTSLRDNASIAKLGKGLIFNNLQPIGVGVDAVVGLA